MPTLSAIDHNSHLFVVVQPQYVRRPAFPYPFFAEESGLIAYGIGVVHRYRRGADYIARILQGAKPSELPIELATKFELVINLKTAKTLGLTVLQILLAGADLVIE